MVYEITNIAELDEFILANPKLIVDFKATWCGPCKMMHPVLKAIDGTDGIRVVAIDVDDADDIAAHYNIRSMPTFIFFKDGAETGRVTGFRNQEQITAEAEKYFA